MEKARFNNEVKEKTLSYNEVTFYLNKRLVRENKEGNKNYM